MHFSMQLNKSIAKEASILTRADNARWKPGRIEFAEVEKLDFGMDFRFLQSFLGLIDELVVRLRQRDLHQATDVVKILPSIDSIDSCKCGFELGGIIVDWIS
jgi:hypothetical protein